MIAEILLRQASILQDKGAPALDEEERRTLVEFSRLAVLIAAPDDSSPPTVVSHVQKELTTRDWRVACGGCGIVHPSETNLVKCDNCKVLIYCSDACRQDDWESYHKGACRRKLA